MKEALNILGIDCIIKYNTYPKYKNCQPIWQGEPEKSKVKMENLINEIRIFHYHGDQCIPVILNKSEIKEIFSMITNIEEKEIWETPENAFD
jgi:hypothetical protein